MALELYSFVHKGILRQGFRFFKTPKQHSAS